MSALTGIQLFLGHVAFGFRGVKFFTWLLGGVAVLAGLICAGVIKSHGTDKEREGDGIWFFFAFIVLIICLALMAGLGVFE